MVSLAKINSILMVSSFFLLIQATKKIGGEKSSLFHPSMRTVIYTKEQVSKQINEKKIVSMLFFYRSGCPYCREFLPVFKKLGQEYQGKPVEFLVIEFSNDAAIRKMQKEKIAQEDGIAIVTFPCLVFYKNGQVKQVLQGDSNERSLMNLRKKMDELLV